MPPDIDPSALTPHELSKMNKKDLARHISTLQEMYTVRGRKYGMCYHDPYGRWVTTDLIIRQGQVYHSQEQTNNSSQACERYIDPQTTWPPLPRFYYLR